MIARVSLPATDADVARISQENPGWQVEREADGSIVMSPTGAASGRRGIALVRILLAWNDPGDRGYLFDSSTGFKMPDGALLSPDAAWIERSRYDALSPAERDDFSPIVPDVWIELVSKSDDARSMRAKAQRIRQYGGRYTLVIDPFERTTWTLGDPPPDFPTDFEAVFDA